MRRALRIGATGTVLGRRTAVGPAAESTAVVTGLRITLGSAPPTEVFTGVGAGLAGSDLSTEGMLEGGATGLALTRFGAASPENSEATERPTSRKRSRRLKSLGSCFSVSGADGESASGPPIRGASQASAHRTGSFPGPERWQRQTRPLRRASPMRKTFDSSLYPRPNGLNGITDSHYLFRSDRLVRFSRIFRMLTPGNPGNLVKAIETSDEPVTTRKIEAMLQDDPQTPSCATAWQWSRIRKGITRTAWQGCDR